MAKEIVGLRIRELRKARKLSQEELASRVGLTPRMISAIERKERLPSLDALCSIAHGLGVSSAALLEPSSPQVDKARLSWQAGQALNALPPHEQLRMAIAVIERIASRMAGESVAGTQRKQPHQTARRSPRSKKSSD